MLCTIFALGNQIVQQEGQVKIKEDVKIAVFILPYDIHAEGPLGCPLQYFLPPYSYNTSGVSTCSAPYVHVNLGINRGFRSFFAGRTSN